MVALPIVIPPEERYPGLREFLFAQVETVQRVRAEHPELMPGNTSPFLILSYPFLAAPTSTDERELLGARRAEFEAAGFDGNSVVTQLRRILEVDRHLRECCPSTSELAHFFDVWFISPSLQLPIGAKPGVSNAVFEGFLKLTYAQGRFRSIALSHLFNFEAHEPSLRFGSVQVERLDSPTVAMVIGEATPQSFFHPPNAGDFFVVSEREGSCEDVVGWLFDEKSNAEHFTQVLQYFKDGIVHVDYTVPHFQPPWVNELRKGGVYFFGNPRRIPYENGLRPYRIAREDVSRIAAWWTAYTSDEVTSRLREENHKLRQASLRAGEYYELSHSRENPVDRLITLAIALESLFSPQDLGEFTFRISQSVSQLVGTTPTERLEINRSIKDMYARRSKLFHGQYDVQEFSQGRFVTHGECERWASVIRRAVLAFFVLFLRGENQREAILDRVNQAALDGQQGDALRQLADFQSLLDEFQART